MASIIIFHDSDENAQADRHPTVEALRTILPALKAAGYRMVTVSELIHRPGSPCRPGEVKDWDGPHFHGCDAAGLGQSPMS